MHIDKNFKDANVFKKGMAILFVFFCLFFFANNRTFSFKFDFSKLSSALACGVFNLFLI